MKRAALITAVLLMLPCLLMAQADTLRHFDIAGISVTSRRTLTEIGTQKSVMDSLAIRDDISKSLADVLSHSSSVFIKSYGRATLSTASFRGTAPSHTQVTWNGMKINSPMLGMVDFSLIPSYFTDEVVLYHGASSVGITGGGLGGAITLGTKPAGGNGPSLKYVQGIGSFATYDQFLRVAYGGERLQSSTRVFYGRSRNDFEYTNYDKEIFIFDDEGKITGSYYPVERNRNGSFADLHLLQEFYYDAGRTGDFSLAGWYTDSSRGIPMISTDYKEESEHEYRQDERTLRISAGWDKRGENCKFYAKAGYAYTDFRYVYKSSITGDYWADMIDSRSYIHTAFVHAGAEYYIGDKWLFNAGVSADQHTVDSRDRTAENRNGINIIGYEEARFDMSAFASARWRPTERLGLAVNMRGEMYGNKWSPVIPAAFAEYMLLPEYGIVAKASAARNYRFPTLNDLYFKPGGNPDLRPERGVTYDAGLGFSVRRKRFSVTGEVTYYDSVINDWIMWLGTGRNGVWTPVNIKKVHSYGVEVKEKAYADLGSGWSLHMDANYTLSRAINLGDPHSEADESVGKQLVYIPVHSTAFCGRLGWRSWAFTYKFSHYSRRFTSTSNDMGSITGSVGNYFMNDITLEKSFAFNWMSLSLKLAVNNIFNEEYVSVMSRPMAGRNFGLYVEITPKFRKTKSLMN